MLVAEDHAAVRRLAVRTLTEAGYEVLEANDGVSSLAIAEAYSGKIQVLVTGAIAHRA